MVCIKKNYERARPWISYTWLDLFILAWCLCRGINQDEISRLYKAQLSQTTRISATGLWSRPDYVLLRPDGKTICAENKKSMHFLLHMNVDAHL